MILLVFPNQLFENHPGLSLNPQKAVLIEENLFFGDSHYSEKFHKQKLWLLRTAMKRYEQKLNREGRRTAYVDHSGAPDSLQQVLATEKLNSSDEPCKICTIEPVDFMLRKRLDRIAERSQIDLEYLSNPGFLNSDEINIDFRRNKNRWFMNDFYQWQRRRLNLLMEGDQPLGQKWSFDHENRKKIPKTFLKDVPNLPALSIDEVDESNRTYVNEKYGRNPGDIDKLLYPTSHQGAARWLQLFLQDRFVSFGDYEDAIEQGENTLWHSVLTPMLNIGLLTPDQVIDETLRFVESKDIPINSLEGFVRQIIGWREFVRATYTDKGVVMRNSNQWNHKESMPSCFYDGTTGILPVDDCIRRVLQTGYCHHIERLMVLGGFMFLCEIEPHQIYRWFMEMFVDSYDWVMVPNVYGMSQHTGGESITSKPYFSGSSYIRKMSHYPKADWCDTWDGLYWRWIWKNKDELRQNPRWAMMCSMVEKMDSNKRDLHLKNADVFLSRLD